MSNPHFNRLALIGLGLIGSSIARVCKERGLVDEVIGCAPSQATRDKALEIGFADRVFEDPAEAVAGADLVILCSPLGTFKAIARQIGGALKQGAIVSDAGSTKSSVIDALAPHLPDGVHLVPGHPVAGTEHSGPEAGFADLFIDRFCILTPPKGADAGAVGRLRAFWEACGSDVEIMDPHHHDRVLAITSHLPHLIAYTIVGTAGDLEGQLEREDAESTEMVATREVIKYSAGGFRDFTRIAGSDPIMWRDVFLNNKEAVLEMLGRFSEDLVALQRAIRWGEGEKLEEWFRHTREVRRGVIEMRQAGSFSPLEPHAQDEEPGGAD